MWVSIEPSYFMKMYIDTEVKHTEKIGHYDLYSPIYDTFQLTKMRLTNF